VVERGAVAGAVDGLSSSLFSELGEGFVSDAEEFFPGDDSSLPSCCSS
jgi:hypothetical protein